MLGVYFDEYLSFDSHISQLCKNISKSLFSKNKIKFFVNLDALKKLYYALVHLSISYCINVYGSANKTTLAPLCFLQQKKSIRIISRAKYSDHTSPLFSKLEILPLEQLILYNRLKFMHNYYFCKLPLPFHNLWSTNAERNPIQELRNANDYFIPPHRIELVKRMPLFSFPAAWNAETDEKIAIPCLLAYLWYLYVNAVLRKYTIFLSIQGHIRIIGQ